MRFSQCGRKKKVYASEHTTVDDMKIRITNAFHSITPNLLSATLQRFHDGINTSRVNRQRKNIHLTQLNLN